MGAFHPRTRLALASASILTLTSIAVASGAAAGLPAAAAEPVRPAAAGPAGPTYSAGAPAVLYAAGPHDPGRTTSTHWAGFGTKGSYTKVTAGWIQPKVTCSQSSEVVFWVGSSDVLYAPTMKPADGSCIEVVTVHTTGTPQIWAWDWCKSNAPGAEVNVNSSFVAKYTTTVNGRTVYTQENVLTNAAKNTWTSYLYDYPTKSWDKLFSSSGTDQSGLAYGWDMFEFYSSTNPSTGNTYVCGDIAKANETFESSSVEIDTAGGWSPAGPSDSTWMPSASPNPKSYKCPDLVFHIVTDNSDWTVSES